MKFLLMVFLIFIVSCAPKYDKATSPASLNQKTLLLKHQGKIYEGLLPITTPNIFKTYILGEGSLDITGTDNCTYDGSIGSKKAGWVQFDFSNIPQQDLCILNIQSSVKTFDAPAIGNIIVRRFDNPNIEKLKTSVDDVISFGIHALQIKEHQVKTVKVFPKSETGKLIVTGCKLEKILDYSKLEFTTEELEEFIGETEACALTITANNDDYLKESTTVYISYIKEIGSDLSAPAFYIQNDKACFSFSDKYVIGVYINGKISKINKRKLCVSKSAKYDVIGATSKHRIFYGIHNGSEWEE